MTKKTLRFIAQPRDQVYRCLLQAAVQAASSAYVVVTDSMGMSARAQDCLSRLKPHLVSEHIVSEWPGTRLLAGQARMLTYRSSSSLLQVMETSAGGLYDWIQPELPEDLGFLRSDGSVWLGSIAHEADAWLEIETSELSHLLALCPEIAKIIE